MSNLYVPVVAELPADDYETLLEWSASVELPAEVRAVLTRNGWSQEQVLLGRLLSADAASVRDERA